MSAAGWMSVAVLLLACGVLIAGLCSAMGDDE